MEITPIRMPPTPVNHAIPAKEAAKAAPIAEERPVRPQPVQKKDTVVLSEQAKDLAAQLSGKTFAEEAKNLPLSKLARSKESQGSKATARQTPATVAVSAWNRFATKTTHARGRRFTASRIHIPN